MTDLAPLTDAQRAVADARARSAVAAAEAEARANPNGFVSVRDTRATALRMGTPVPDVKAEKAMLRAAGVGWFAAGAVLGEWESTINAADEAARFHGEPVDVTAVARQSLAWCIAGRPSEHPIAALALLSRDVTTADVHDERLRPTYRRLLDRWRTLQCGA